MQTSPTAVWAALRRGRRTGICWLALLACIIPAAARSAGTVAGGSVPELAAETAPSLVWGVPFVLLLLAIALLPALLPRFWNRRMGVVSLTCSLALLLPRAWVAGAPVAAAEAWHALLIEYLPFATLLLSLYTAGGGVLLQGGPAGRTAGNTAMLALGLVLGILVGTTAASIVIIQPLLRANAHRSQTIHLVVFLVVLVANAGGALTPLGNPPLYVGLLHGVPFFWPAIHLLAPFLLLSGVLLAAFWLLDRHLARHDPPPPEPAPFRLRGWSNVGLIVLVVAAVMLQGFVHLRSVILFNQPVGVEHLLALGVFIVVTGISLWTTPRAIRQANDFVWHPMAEVAVLFAGIFITIAPVAVMLRAGLAGPLAPLLRQTLDSQGQPIPLLFFWLSGMLSAFLDNTPTYLVFFDMARIHPSALSGAQQAVLQAISAGATFFGGLTYIGNAPNMMIRAIASHRGVRMPGFFGFILLSGSLLLPVFLLLSLVFFR